MEKNELLEQARQLYMGRRGTYHKHYKQYGIPDVMVKVIDVLEFDETEKSFSLRVQELNWSRGTAIITANNVKWND